MTRTNLQLAKTGVRNPPVYFCRQCIAVRVFEEGGICPTCVNIEFNNAKAADARDKVMDTILGLGLSVVLVAFFYIFLVLWTND